MNVRADIARFFIESGKSLGFDSGDAIELIGRADDEIKKLDAQRDELLAALRAVHYYLHDAKNLPASPGAGLAETLRAVDTALAAAEGK